MKSLTSECQTFIVIIIIEHKTYHLENIISSSLIFFNHLKNDMFEHTAYYIASVGLSFAAIFLSLEAAWHFTACKIHDKPIKPCFYKQIGILK
jgi:hypothetical protein